MRSQSCTEVQIGGSGTDLLQVCAPQKNTKRKADALEDSLSNLPKKPKKDTKPATRKASDDKKAAAKLKTSAPATKATKVEASSDMVQACMRGGCFAKLVSVV